MNMYRYRVVSAVLAAPTDTTKVTLIPDGRDRRHDLFLLHHLVPAHGWVQFHSVARHEDDRLLSAG